MRRSRIACAVSAGVAALVISTSSPTSAQSPAPAAFPAPGPAGNARWALLDAIGYGGLGFAVGLASTFDMEGDDFGPPGAAIAIIGATTVAGAVAGAMIGRRASRAFVEGRGVGSGHRVAVIGGTLLAGGTLGALAAVPLINPDGEGTFLGSDEQTLALLVLGGVALGGIHAWRHREQLAPARLQVAPTLAANGRGGLHLRVRF